MNRLYTLVPRILPQNSDKRHGVMKPTYITIHETSLGTDLKDTHGGTWYGVTYYESILVKPTDTHVGYHFLVEANKGQISRVYNFLEPTIVAYHTGSPEGNHCSIGIERLVNTDTDMERAIHVQASLTAELMGQYHIPLSHVVPHRYWSGKECPGRLLAGLYGGWDGFIDKVRYEFVTMYEPCPILLDI